MVICTQRVFVGFFGAMVALLLATGCGTSGNGAGDGQATPQVGEVTEALGTSPDTGCTGTSYKGHDYWFCPVLRSWSSARSRCEAAGYNLVRIEDKAENDFVKARVGLDSWIGGNDTAVEGTWRWTFGGSQFWTGTASGSPFGGLFNKWGHLQPDNLLNQDCARMAALDGTWTDESCALALKFVCESGVDQCPSDPQKVIPGRCGCNVPDTDTDGDGTPDCQDQCPSDPTKVTPGDCGCANAPKPVGTPCGDGLCSANTSCRAGGVCGDPTACTAPESGCTSFAFQNEYYWLCNHNQTTSAARTKCQAVGMDLAAIESQAEDDLITSKASLFDHVLLGGSDSVNEGTWVWTPTGQTFWSGGVSGAPVGGAYTSWESGEPNDLGTEDCMVKDPKLAGAQWESWACGVATDYLCEQQDQCPTDPFKKKPGQCGCNVPDVDSDGDHFADCLDGCPRDPSKVDPGVCGCNKPDTDTDHDGVPDCGEDFPGDPGRSKPSSCSPSTGKVAPGTNCQDGVCPGAHQCTSAGNCGDGSDCAPAPGCVARAFGDSWYWFCNTPTTWTAANTACTAVPGRTLVRIDSQKENSFVTENVSGAAWTGGSDQAAEGAWKWSTPGNPQFWSGGATGSLVNFSFNHWAPGNPSAAAGENCLALQNPTATWDDRSCTQALGYVCEQSRLRLTSSPQTPTFGNTQPGLTGTLNPQPSPTCVPTNQAPLYGPNAGTEIANCNDACHAPGATEATCRAACTGAATPPPAGASCPPDPAQFRYCAPDLNNVQTPLTLCGADPNNPDAECAAGFYCLHERVGVSETCRVCATSDGNNDCNNDCNAALERNICAKPDPACLWDGTNCDEQELCTPPDGEQTTTGLDPDSTLTAAPQDPTQLFGPPQPDRPATEKWPDETETPCGGAAVCPPDDATNRWCHYDLAPTETLGDRSQDGTDANGKRKHGSAGKGKLIQFDFDPNLLVKVGSTPGPLGIVDAIDLKTEATLAAHARLSVLGFSKNVEIIELGAQLEANRCGIHTPPGASFKILGIDFLPLLTGKGGVNGLPFNGDTSFSSEPKEADCEKAYAAFQVLVDRAKKAHKDARNLIEQFKALPAGKRFSNTWFKDLGLQAPRNFAPPPVAGEWPQQTINRFIDYYNGEISGLQQGAHALVDKVLDGLPQASLPIVAVPGRDETQVLATANFFIGPLPCTMDLEAAVSYGLDVNANFEYSPATLVSRLIDDRAPQSQEDTLAFAKLNGSPHAGASVRLFVGAGFSVPGFSASAGVEGEVALGTISVPTYAGIGIDMGASEDPRPFPAGLQALQTSPNDKQDTWIHPKQYHFFLRYTLGSRVAIRNILDGSLSARLRIEFLFFSKTWRQVILNFHGFCHADAQGNAGPGCDIPLFAASGSLDTPLDGATGWGVIRMPMPFIRMKPLDLVPPDESLPTIPVNANQEGEFFYDSICTCIGAPNTTPPPTECFRNDDCCPNLAGPPPDHPICFHNPEDGNKAECSACRTTGTSCEKDSDCCPGIVGGTDANNVAFVCHDRPSAPGVGKCGCYPDTEKCSVNTECCSKNCDMTGVPLGGKGTCLRVPE